MKRTAWFERKFPPVEDNGLLPGIIERLEGTAARLRNKIKQLHADLSIHDAGKWSIKSEIGHLSDLEPLWLARMQQIIAGETALIKADLTNQKTHEANHDEATVEALIAQFETERDKMVHLLRGTSEQDLEKAAIHPRLGTPMRLIDLAFFVAEHDDHHLAQITQLASIR